MRMRTGYDGEHYWVEQKQLFWWRKCCIYKPDARYRDIRFCGNTNKLYTQEEAYNYVKEWRLAYDRSGKSNVIVYAEVN